jgi:hypothetical protein
MILADFCNRPNSTSTRATARLPRRRALRSTLDAGGGSFDAVPPASIALSTLSSRAARRGAPHRRGASLWRRYQPLAALEARSLTPLFPTQASRVVRAVAPCLRQTARHDRPKAPSIDRCSPRPLALGREPATISRGPMPTELASGAMPSALSLRRLICAGIQGSSPRSLAGRRLSVSAIIAVLQHNRGQTVHPAHRPRSCPLGSVMRAALHLTVQGRPSCLGPGATEGRNPRQRPLGR